NVAYSQLYINEFMASNDVSFPGPQGDYPDWIEIYNAGTEAVMLGGYYMSDVLDDTAAMYQIPDTYPDSVTVAAGGYILFYANKGEASSVFNLNFKLSGGGEAVGLWDASSTLIDSYTYGEQTTDISFGRYPDGADEWGFMSDITPGASNATPDPPATVLFINEFMASNDVSFPGPQGDFPDWIEIYNPGAEAVNLAGYYMADDLGDTAAMYQIPATYPDSVTVEAGGFIVFYANKEEASSVLNLDFKLSGGGEQIGLWNADQIFMDSLTYGEQITDTSYGRYQDGTDNWYFMADITPGASNINPNPPPTIELYINEFMASNDSSFPGPQGDYPDWIEIYNPGTEAVMLGGYFMSDDLVDPAAMYQISDAYPDSVTVEAGGFIVFYANKEEASSV
ncbi:MAG: lamin tail domain-containing protein, partial [Bacteroidales bacterium]|nr:lamin tail domain-containing protein [Bacteroidales bacterium]